MTDFPSSADLKQARALIQAELDYRAALGTLGQALAVYDAAAQAYEAVQQALAAGEERLRGLEDAQTQARIDFDQMLAEKRHTYADERERFQRDLDTLHLEIQQADVTLEEVRRQIATTQDTLGQVKLDAQQQVEQAVQAKRRELERDIQALQADKAGLEVDIEGLRRQHAEMIQTIANVQDRYQRAFDEQRRLEAEQASKPKRQATGVGA